MSLETLRDLIAQASVDEALQIKLVSAAYSIEEIIKVASDAGYNITKEDIASHGNLTDEQLSNIGGGAGKTVQVFNALGWTKME